MKMLIMAYAQHCTQSPLALADLGRIIYFRNDFFRKIVNLILKTLSNGVKIFF